MGEVWVCYYYGSIALCWALATFSVFRSYTQSVGLLGRGVSPLQGRYLHTEQHKHRINAHSTDIHALSVIRTHDPSVRVSEESSRLSPNGHCDRQSEYVPHLITASLISLSKLIYADITNSIIVIWHTYCYSLNTICATPGIQCYYGYWFSHKRVRYMSRGDPRRCRPLELQLRGEILPIQIAHLLENFSFDSHAFSISGNTSGREQSPWEKL
jgi:hypothetical protein